MLCSGANEKKTSKTSSHIKLIYVTINPNITYSPDLTTFYGLS